MGTVHLVRQRVRKLGSAGANSSFIVRYSAFRFEEYVRSVNVASKHYFYIAYGILACKSMPITMSVHGMRLFLHKLSCNPRPRTFPVYSTFCSIALWDY